MGQSLEAKFSYDAEEYVEAIYRLQKRSGVARTKDLAKALGVVPGSITNTVEHLEKHGLVNHEPYRGTTLTIKGEKLALNILRRHRLAERLLTDILEVGWSNVHESACELEHALTKEIIPVLEKRLGYPKLCPHGNPIPTEDGEMEEEQCISLIEIGLKEACKIVKITDGKKENLLLLARKEVRLGVPIHVVRRQHSSLIVCVDGKECTLNNDDASNIWVKATGGNRLAIQT